ncbi:MAG: hypothetical protein IJE90_09240 [Clostridia bacterium]|nr:hypothetical protein [Clostridia bacterium]
MKLKRIAAAAVCVCLLLCVLPLFSVSSAFEGVAFLVINNVVLRPMSADSMPAFIGKEVYIPYSALENFTTVSHQYDARREQLCIYNDSGYLMFDLANDTAYDEQGERVDFSALYLNGTVYIPVNTTCDKFGIYHSVSILSLLAPMVRIHEGELVATDIDFTSRLYSLFSSTYSEFVENNELPVEPIEYTPSIRAAYLAFCGDPALWTEDIIDSFSGVSACFFLTEQEIGANGGFVRQASASGHTVGFMLDPQSDITLTQQYRDANSALSMECSLVSRVVTIKGGSGSLTPDQLSELISLGVRIWDLSPCGTDMSINELLLYKSEGQAPVFAFEAGGQTAEFIVRFLEDTSYVFSPVYDWTRPVNYVGIY